MAEFKFFLFVIGFVVVVCLVLIQKKRKKKWGDFLEEEVCFISPERKRPGRLSASG